MLKKNISVDVISRGENLAAANIVFLTDNRRCREKINS